MKQSRHGIIGLAFGAALLGVSPVWAGMTGDGSPVPSRYPRRKTSRNCSEGNGGRGTKGDYERNQEIRLQIRESGDRDQSGMQLHLIAHSSMRNIHNLPPYETTMHFMWNDVQWRSGRDADARTGQDRRFDKEIKRRIQRHLRANDIIDPQQIEVKVKDGTVTLKGTVASQRAKRAAEDVAMQLEGGSDVKNKLKVDEKLPKGEAADLDAIALYDVDPIEPGIAKEDRELERDIKSELTWSPFVDADSVDVTVRDGVAYLFGTVEDRDEMQAAIDNAIEAGADRIENRLAIQDANQMGRRQRQ
jgi:osmotically-inducible protein OsmY